MSSVATRLIKPLRAPLKPTVRPKKKIRVGFIQLNNSFSGQTYLPLSVGLLQSYAKKFLTFPSEYEFSVPIFQFGSIEEISELLSEHDVVGYSIYGWNEKNSLAIAKAVKKLNPNVLNVFGGPQIPDSQKQFQRIKKSTPELQDLKVMRMSWTEDFHRRNPFIDLACHGEGERVFTEILDRVAIDACYDKEGLPSVSYLDANGNFYHTNKLDRMHDLELKECPSPYLDGTFDPIIERFPDITWIMPWETNRGCPYQCSYCEWGGAIEDKVFKFNMERLREEALWAGQQKIRTIFCCDANFGILKRDVEIAQYLAEAKDKYGYPNGVSVQNAKNPKDHTIEALISLERAGLNRATVMSQQSMNPETLRLVRRENMDLSEYFEMQKIAAKEGVYTMTDIIFPMPAETYDSIARGIDTLISNGQHNRIQFGIISLWPNSEMGDPEYQIKHGIESVEVEIINIHGKKMTSVSGVSEIQRLAIATKAMPREDWVRTRVLTWITDAVYFNKLLQIPAIILSRQGVKFREFMEMFTDGRITNTDFPILSEIHALLTQTALNIQNGLQTEFIHSPDYLDIYWPPGEYLFIKLATEKKLDLFYYEAEKAINLILKNAVEKMPTGLLRESIELNRALLKTPFQNKDLDIHMDYNIWDVYKQTLLGNIIDIETGSYDYTIDRTTETWATWDEWFEKVVWYCNRRGAYLYGNKNPHEEIAGHH